MTRDDFDRKAHDIICMLRYGSTGGGVKDVEMHKIGDYLRGGPFKPKIQVKLPCKPIVVKLPK